MWSPVLFKTSIVAGIVVLTSMIAKSEELSDATSESALSYQSTHTDGCLTLAAARSAHPRGHLYWHGPRHCWDTSPVTVHTRSSKAEKPEHIARSVNSTPLPEEGRPENPQPIAMITDYLAFDTVLDEWRQMSRGLVTPLVDKALSEFDQRWPSTAQR
jgi:hypothetical protein